MLCGPVNSVVFDSSFCGTVFNLLFILFGLIDDVFGLLLLFGLLLCMWVCFVMGLLVMFVLLVFCFGLWV